VVGLGVDGIGSDGVDAKSRHEGDILLATGSVGERVSVVGAGRGSRRSGVLLVAHALDEELRSILEEELGALEVEEVSGRGLEQEENTSATYLD
jgi:hypothetical protein